MMQASSFRDNQDWSAWPDCVTTLEAVKPDATLVSFYREKKSHKGIGLYSTIRKLSAKQVNQDFLDEIGNLRNLEYLEIEVLTATNLDSLLNLKALKTLKIDSVRKADDFSCLLQLPSLTRLFITNAKNITSLDFLADANNLVALGIEGSLYKNQKLRSLSPLSQLKNLEALFLSSVTLEDKSLACLAEIPNLSLLVCARFAPQKEFLELRERMPKLVCSWCDNYEA